RTAEFAALSPDYASRYGGHELRWVNAVRISSHYGAEDIATSIPFNTFDWRWPRLALLGDTVGVGTEGWVYAQRFRDSTTTIQLYTGEDILTGVFGRRGVTAKLSEPGQIAKQIIASLG